MYMYKYPPPAGAKKHATAMVRFVEGFFAAALAAIAILLVFLFKTRDAAAKAQEDSAVCTSAKKSAEEYTKAALIQSVAATTSSDEARDALVMCNKARKEVVEKFEEYTKAALIQSVAATKFMDEAQDALFMCNKAREEVVDKFEECKPLLEKPSRLSIFLNALQEVDAIMTTLTTANAAIDSECATWTPAPMIKTGAPGTSSSATITLPDELDVFCGTRKMLNGLPNALTPIIVKIKNTAELYEKERTPLIFNFCEKYALMVTAFLTYLRNVRKDMATPPNRVDSKFMERVGTYIENMNENATLIEKHAGYSSGYLIFK